MGTSQSFNLKSTPNWTKAKRCMSSLVSGDIDQYKLDALMAAFVLAINDNVAAGDNNNHQGAAHGRHGHSTIFGRAGSSSSRKFLSFVSDVRQNGLAHALQLRAEELQAKQPQEILNDIFKNVSCEDNANFDDDAAKVALNELLTEMIGDSPDADTIEGILVNADQDTICYWIMKFYAIYIAEFLGQIFQKQIYDHSDDANRDRTAIIELIRQKIDERYGNDIRLLNLFSQEGAVFVGDLRDKIIQIWQ